MTGAQALVRALELEGVDLLFGYPGGVVLPIFDALYDSKQIRTILPRHEQGAVHMADGFARVTGRCGVALVTSGPGATNTVTGIANAFMDSIPLVVFTGQVASSVIGTDAFQESDITGITIPDHQAQLPHQGRRRASRGHQGGVLHRHDRPSRSGADRRARRREQARDRLRVAGGGQPARLQAHRQGSQQADQAGRRAHLPGTPAAAVRGRRGACRRGRPRSSRSSPSSCSFPSSRRSWARAASRRTTT